LAQPYQLSQFASIDGISKKSIHSKAEQKELTEKHLQKYYPLDQWEHIYTDGSHDPATKRSGYGIYCKLFEASLSMSADTTILDTELAAIVKAAEIIAENSTPLTNKTKFVIISDCASAIQLPTKAANLNEMTLRYKKCVLSLQQQNKELKLQWVPSHCGIEGNEKADLLAGAARKKKIQKGTLSFTIYKKKTKTSIKSLKHSQHSKIESCLTNKQVDA
jgi:ribonuclease HI